MDGFASPKHPLCFTELGAGVGLRRNVVGVCGCAGQMEHVDEVVPRPLDLMVDEATNEDFCQ